jgi:hypothetical protein
MPSGQRQLADVEDVPTHILADKRQGPRKGSRTGGDLEKQRAGMASALADLG